MIFLSRGNGIWTFGLPLAPGEECGFSDSRGGAYKHIVGVEPSDLSAGCFTLSEAEFPELGFVADLHFFPFDSLNPNLDEIDYFVTIDKQCSSVKRSRRFAFEFEEERNFDLFGDKKIKDFALSFWKSRDSELHPIDEEGKSAICYGISHCGAGSMRISIENSGWRVGSFIRDQRYHLRAMHGLSVAAREVASPKYPPLFFSHFPGQSGAVVPGSSYFTFLRDPIRRLISFYHFARDTGETDDDLDYWIDGICHRGWDDWQMKWLANLSGSLEMSLIPWGINPLYCKATSSGIEMSDLLVEKAKDGVSKFFFIGMTQDFDESLVISSLLMRSRYVGRWFLTNRSSASDGFHLTDRQKSKLERVASPEIELYNEQKNIFNYKYNDELKFIRDHIKSLCL